MRKRANLLWYARMLLVGLVFLFGSLISFFIAVFRFKNPANNLMFIKMVSPLTRRLLGLNVVSRGRAIVDASQPCIFVMNHQLAMDVIVNTDLYPSRCVIIAKRWLGYIPVWGWFLFLSGNILVNRSNRSHTMAKLDDADLMVQRKRLSVWLFPEGTRSRGRGLGPLKKGAFYMAIKGQVPIVPVVASSYVGKMDFGAWRAGRVLVSVLPAIPTIGMTVDDVPALLERTRNAMADGIASLDRELLERGGH